MTQVLKIRIAHPSIQSTVYQGSLEEMKNYFSKETGMTMNNIETESQLISFLLNNVYKMYKGISHSSIFNFTVSKAKRITKRTELVIL